LVIGARATGELKMLAERELMAFVATSRADESLAFYRDVLGLRLVADEPFALVFDAHGVMLRIQKAEGHRPLPYTALGWKVPDIAAELAALRARGVTFERFPGLPQDAQGIWSAPSGARIAWFKDPDGNVLSLAQF
jgi:catechol 2,3-dioxygenase-like lactoylglutathione lyase family enzyme